MKIMKNPPFAAYALKHIDKIRKKSSSGGAFTAILETIQKMHNGEEFPSIIGVAFDSNFDVIYRSVHSLDEINAFRGSKYVRANMKNSLSDIETLLRSGKMVVLCGIPCQVDAARQFVERNRIPKDNLYLIDIICHGTMKGKVWRDYIQWLEKKYNSKLCYFSFRCKDVGWRDYPVSAIFTDGRVITNKQDVQTIMTLYMTRMCMNESCYKCRYASMNRISDITIGDFWGIENMNSEFADNLGVSLLIANTERGMRVCKKLEGRKDLQLWKCDSKEFVKYQLALNGAAHKPKEYVSFWEDYDRCGFELILNKYAGNTFIGKIKYNVKSKIKHTKFYQALKKCKSKMFNG